MGLHTELQEHRHRCGTAYRAVITQTELCEHRAVRLHNYRAVVTQTELLGRDRAVGTQTELWDSIESCVNIDTAASCGIAYRAVRTGRAAWLGTKSCDNIKMQGEHRADPCGYRSSWVLLKRAECPLKYWCPYCFPRFLRIIECSCSTRGVAAYYMFSRNTTVSLYSGPCPRFPPPPTPPPPPPFLGGGGGVGGGGTGAVQYVFVLSDITGAVFLWGVSAADESVA